MRLIREDDGSLRAEEKDSAAFDAAKSRIIEAYQKNHELFMADGLTNSVVNTTNLHEEYGSVYIVSTWLNGQTFADAEPETLHDCIALVLSTAKVLKKIHGAGFLYLDLKPDNILTIKGSLDLVQLFDFDSMISMTDLENAVRSNHPAALRASYTRGYAPLELQTGKIRQIGRHSDLYSLGAILFEALWHRTPNAFDCEENAEYDFASIAYNRINYQDTIFRELTVFFHKTLASYYGDRYKDAGEAIEQLRRMLTLSDETRPWLFSTPISAPVFFAGREKEMEALSKLLCSSVHHVFNLYGMGGIGKSTLVRAWLSSHRNAYDAILWLYDQGKTEELLCDDLMIHVNTVERMKDESQEEYLGRKLRTLSEIVSRQHILVIVDNVLPEHMENLQPLLTVGWDVLLISRPALTDGIQKAETERLIKLKELELQEQREIHGRNLRKVLTTLWLIISVILLIIIISKIAGSSDGFTSGFLMLFYIGGPIIGSGAYLIFKWLPEKENEKIIEKQGGIRFPGELAPFSDKKYFPVEDTLRSVGFTNVTCVNLHDLNMFTALVSSDKIDKITINGKAITSGGKIYMPDVPIVITYHGR